MGILLMIFLSSFIFFAKKEFSFTRSFGSLVKPVDWFKYYTELEFRKINSKIFFNKKNGLPMKHLYVSEKNLDKLMSKIPDSTKVWQKGFIFENGKQKKINIRYLGDNLNNWIFENKSMKLKYSKKNFEENYRSFDYFVPRLNSQNEFEFTRIISHYLMKEFGLLTPEVKMVEIKINGENKGIYLEIPKQDEIFLRNNNVMPVNIYKGENANTELKIGIDRNLFNNPYLWSKISVFNQTDLSNKDDLIYFFKLLRDFNNNSIPPEFFFSKIPADEWAKFLISGASDHGTNIQNQRLVSDPWSGKYLPLPIDSVFDLNVLLEHKIDRDYYSNYRDRVLNSDPYFILSKYKIYYDYIFNKKLLASLANYLRNIKPKLLNSSERDFHFIKSIYEQNIKRKNFDLFYNNKNLENQINKLIENLENSTNNNNYFIKDINATWTSKDNTLFFTLKDKLPSGDIMLNLSNEIDFNGLEVKLLNKNKFFYNQNIPYEIINEKTLLLKTSLVADRVLSLNKKTHNINNEIKPTLFKFKFNKQVWIDSIKVLNIFSNKFSEIKFSNKVGLNISKNNYAIVNKNDFTTNLSGNIYYDQNKIFNEKVIIKPDTKFYLKKGVSIIFKNKLIAEGSKSKPIIFKQLDKNDYWGSILLIGKKTNNSVLKNIFIEGGSGGWVENIKSTAMLSIHDTQNIEITNIFLNNNNEYDDMIHLVYSESMKIKNLEMKNINSDGIDIDISKNIEIDNISIFSAKNDCLDFMQTTANIKNSLFQNCKDKGISVGEKSNIFISKSYFLNNNIAIESKDKSVAKVKTSKFISNELAFSAYKKNWKYNGGGTIKSENNIILNNKKTLNQDKFSSIIIN
jgi:hypothetical protein